MRDVRWEIESEVCSAVDRAFDSAVDREVPSSVYWKLDPAFRGPVVNPVLQAIEEAMESEPPPRKRKSWFNTLKETLWKK